ASCIVEAGIIGRRHAMAVCLLMPPLLLVTDDPIRWRRRVMLLAALALSLCGLGGVGWLASDGASIQSAVGGSLADGFRAAMQRPLPLVGMWPLLGIASGGLLFSQIGQPRRALINLAIAAGIGFCTLLALVRFRWSVAPAT